MFIIDHQVVEAIVSRCVKVIFHNVEPFSECRNGIMGNHYLLSVGVARDPELESPQTLTFFVKTPSGSYANERVIVEESVFLEEVNFYKRVYPYMKPIKGEQFEKWSPDCRLARSDCLVLEDLRCQGYAIGENSIFDKPQLMAALGTLARFHAASIVAEKRLGKPLNRTFPDAFREKIFTDVGKGGRSNKLGFKTLELLAQRFHLDGAEIPRILNQLYEVVKPIAGGCNTLCHGDLWRGNIMFKHDGTNLKSLLVDFQMLRYASPSLDVAMMLYVHATSEMRESLELDMLRLYYRVFQETLLSNQVGVPPFEDILRDYRDRRIIGMTYQALRWPPAVMAKINDSRVLESWYFHSRIDHYNSLLDGDPVYEATMKASLKELIDEGKRMSSLPPVVRRV